MIFFSSEADAANGKTPEIPPPVTLVDILNRERKLNELGVPCQVKSLRSGNYIVACRGEMCCDFNGLSPETTVLFLDQLILATQSTQSHTKGSQAILNAAKTILAESSKSDLSRYLYDQWKKPRTFGPKSREQDVKQYIYFINYAKTLCENMGVKRPRMPILRLANYGDSDYYWGDKILEKLTPETERAWFDKVVSATVCGRYLHVAQHHKEDSARKSFNQFSSPFLMWWKHEVVPVLDSWPKNPSARITWKFLFNAAVQKDFAAAHPKATPFQLWSYSVIRSVNLAFSPVEALATIYDEMGDKTPLLDISMEPFKKALVGMSPLEWRVASCLLEIDKLNH